MSPPYYVSSSLSSSQLRRAVSISSRNDYLITIKKIVFGFGKILYWSLTNSLNWGSTSLTFSNDFPTKIVFLPQACTQKTGTAIAIPEIQTSGGRRRAMTKTKPLIATQKAAKTERIGKRIETSAGKIGLAMTLTPASVSAAA